MVTVYDVLDKYAAQVEGEKPVADPDRGAPAVDTKRYYFFEAPPESSIQFTSMNDILKRTSPEKAALVQKLQGGNTGQYFADYFVWDKVALRTNKYSQDGKTYVVYTCDLNPIGTKRENTARVYPDGAPVTAETIETDFLLFEDKAGNENVVNPDKGSESTYIDQKAPADIGQMLLKNIVPAGNKMVYDVFSRKFDEYRIYVPNLRQLMLPDFNKPTHDQLKGGYGHYLGGQKAYQEQVEPYAKEEQGESPESLKDKMEESKEAPQEAEGPRFRPGTQPVAPTEGEKVEPGDSALKTASKRKRRRSGDYASEPYSGGTDVMQRLVRDQQETMDVRQAAMRVVAQIMSKGPAPSATGATATDQPSVPISEDPQKNEESSKLFSDIAKKQQEIKKMHETIVKQVSTQGMGPKF